MTVVVSAGLLWFAVSQTSQAVDLAGLKLRNPIVLAAGTHGTLDEISQFVDLSRVGALVTKSITLKPREGNAGVRVVPLRVGMLNAVGLANPGVEAFVRDYAPRIEQVPCPVIGSIAGFSVEDYVEVARAFEPIEHMPAVELNVSCPNVHAGLEFGVDPSSLRELVGRVRRVLKTTRLIVKLSPIVAGNPGMVEVARAAIEGQSEPGGPNDRAGADVLTISNTVPAMKIDIETGKPVLSNGSGGLSGPAIHLIVVKLVYDVHHGVAKETDTPIIGLGGVCSWRGRRGDDGGGGHCSWDGHRDVGRWEECGEGCEGTGELEDQEFLTVKRPTIRSVPFESKQREDPRDPRVVRFREGSRKTGIVVSGFGLFGAAVTLAAFTLHIPRPKWELWFLVVFSFGAVFLGVYLCSFRRVLKVDRSLQGEIRKQSILNLRGIITASGPVTFLHGPVRVWMSVHGIRLNRDYFGVSAKVDGHFYVLCVLKSQVDVAFWFDEQRRRHHWPPAHEQCLMWQGTF